MERLQAVAARRAEAQGAPSSSMAADPDHAMREAVAGKPMAIARWRQYEALVKAAKGVVWYDWSGNDDDAVADVQALEDALRAGKWLP